MTDSLFVRALRFPASDDDWIKTVGIGGLLNSLRFLVVPALFVSGFMIEVIRESLGDDDDIPEFEDFVWEDLATDGVKLLVIWFAVTTVLSTVYVVVSVVLFGTSMVVGGPDAIALVTGVLMLALLPLAFAVAYVVPIMTVNFAREDDLSAAFDSEVIAQVATTEEYLVGWLTVVAIRFVQVMLTVVLGLTVVGILLVPWLAFYFMVATNYAYGRTFDRAFEANPGPN